MKTPREILFDRQKEAGPRLDQIRRTVVDNLREPRRSFALKLWEELVLPARRAWMALAAAWVVVLALNLMTGRETSVSVSNNSGPMNPDSVIALQRQERLMAQSIEKDEDPSLPSKAQERSPRSEAPVEHKVA
jgi:hypothetical protein